MALRFAFSAPGSGLPRQPLPAPLGMGGVHVGADARQRVGVTTPAQVECRQRGKPELAGIGLVVMNPPGQWRPVAMLVIPRQQRRNHNADSRTQVTLNIGVVPNMRGVALHVGGAIVLVIAFRTASIYRRSHYGLVERFVASVGRYEDYLLPADIEKIQRAQAKADQQLLSRLSGPNKNLKTSTDVFRCT